jgi:hypothetical protein
MERLKMMKLFSHTSPCLFLCLFGVAENLFPDDSLCGFIQVLIERILDLQELRPKRVVDE